LIASLDPLLATTNDGTAAWDGYTEAAEGSAEALDTVTSAEERAATALALNVGLSDERAAAMRRLTDQLREGTITVDEWVEGQENASRASEAAANFVAAYGDQLSVIPGLQERMAATGESAAGALLGMLLENPDTIDERIGILDSMIEIAETQEEVATAIAETPIELSIETKELIKDADNTKVIFEWLTAGTFETKRILDETKIEPQVSLEKLKKQAAAALKVMAVMLEAERAFNASHSAEFQGSNPEVGQAARSGARNAATNVDNLNSAIAELERAAGILSGAGTDISDESGALGEAFGEITGITGDDPRLDSSRDSQPSQTGIIDIGDLPPSAVQAIVAMATAAQKKVVAAGGVVDDDETAAFFKDGAFLSLINNVDQRFLQQAIEELTEVEKRRLELEQQRLQDVTRSLVSRVGPIQSLISAPVLAAGGGVLTGQGVNADPTLGNFTINVPINWSGMSLTELQKAITATITQAFIDAQSGG
jgi:hypothetical protein